MEPKLDDRPWHDYSVTMLRQEIDNASRDVGNLSAIPEFRQAAYEIRRQLYRELWTRREKARK